MGACSAEGVGDGQNPAKIRFRHLFRRRDLGLGGSLVVWLRKPVKQHICCFYWLTRGGEVAAGGGSPGEGFWYTKSFRVGGVRL